MAPPPQVTMGLLTYITTYSLDGDYAHVAQRDTDGSRDAAAQSRSGLAALVMLALFGLLVATAAVQTARNASTAQNGHDELVTQIKARSAKVNARRAQVADLRREVERLKSHHLETTAQGRSLSTRLSRLGELAGSVAVAGPGVKVVVDDAVNASRPQNRVQARDLQMLVNALWTAGAEAISVNGYRLTNLSPIREAGDAITVNFKSLSRPYKVLAIGNPNQLPARFLESTGGSAWLDLQNIAHLQFDMTTEESLKVPADQDLSLRYATTPEASR